MAVKYWFNPGIHLGSGFHTLCSAVRCLLPWDPAPLGSFPEAPRPTWAHPPALPSGTPCTHQPLCVSHRVSVGGGSVSPADQEGAFGGTNVSWCLCGARCLWLICKYLCVLSWSTCSFLVCTPGSMGPLLNPFLKILKILHLCVFYLLFLWMVWLQKSYELSLWI